MEGRTHKEEWPSHYVSCLLHTSYHISPQLLDKSSSSRLGCGPNKFADVTSHPFFKNINWTHLLAGRVTPPFKPSVRPSMAQPVMPCTLLPVTSLLAALARVLSLLSHIAGVPLSLYFSLPPSLFNSPKLCMLRMFWI